MLQVIYSYPQPVHQQVEPSFRAVDGRVSEKPNYTIHKCDPNHITAWEKLYGYKDRYHTSCHHLGLTDYSGWIKHCNYHLYSVVLPNGMTGKQVLESMNKEPF